MRSIISEYIELSIYEKDELWKTAIFIFDTNVFLNLYRYSKKTREILFSAMEQLKDRIWMPYHVALEIMKRRYEVIFETIERYDKLSNEAKTFLNICSEALRKKNDDDEMVELQEYIYNWLSKDKNKNVLVSNPIEDSILEQILTLFEGRTGQKYDEDILKIIKEEGERRYKYKIPPGYKDANKQTKEDDDNNKYGDYIIWKQIIDYAKKTAKNIVFVTHDQKEDWWNIVHGKTVGPRIEIRKEFFEETSKKFHMYTMNMFIERFNGTVDQSIVDELNYIGKKHSEKRSLNKVPDPDKLLYQISLLERDVHKRKNVINNLIKKYEGKEIPDVIRMQIDNTTKNLYNKEIQLLKKQENLRGIKVDGHIIYMS